MMMGFGVVGLLFMLLFWGVLIAGAIALVRGIFPQGGPAYRSHTRSEEDPRQILDQRYARGEVTREEYEIMKKDLET